MIERFDPLAALLGFGVPTGGALLAVAQQAPWWQTLGALALSVVFAGVREWVVSRSKERALQAALDRTVEELAALRAATKQGSGESK